MCHGGEVINTHGQIHHGGELVNLPMELDEVELFGINNSRLNY